MSTPLTRPEILQVADVIAATNDFAAKLNACHVAYMKKNFPGTPDNCMEQVVVKKVGMKWIYIDIGTSGAWLIEKTTGEIYNIKSAYGVPDHNKKAKANLGNVRTADPAYTYSRRWNYLNDRFN